MSADQAKQFTEQALESLKTHQYEAAIEFARQAVELDDRNADAYGALGIALSRSNRPDEATEALQKAIQNAPYNPRSFYNLAAHFYAMGKKADALAMAQEAIRCDAQHKPSIELARRVEVETRTVVAPYQSSIGEGRGVYDYDRPSGPTVEPQPPAGAPAGRPGPYEQPPSPYIRPPQPGHYQPGVYPKPKHALKWVQELGATWDVAGWVFFLGLIGVNVWYAFWYFDWVSTIAASGSEPDPFAFMDLLGRESVSLMIAWFLSFGLLIFWWIADAVDRRPSGGLMAAAVLGMVGALCCPCITLIAFPIYAISRRAG